MEFYKGTFHRNKIGRKFPKRKRADAIDYLSCRLPDKKTWIVISCRCPFNEHRGEAGFRNHFQNQFLPSLSDFDKKKHLNQKKFSGKFVSKTSLKVHFFEIPHQSLHPKKVVKRSQSKLS